MKKLLQPLFAGLLLAAGFATGAGATDFGNVSVHDPSVIRTPEGMYYIIGSHMAGAKSPDLMRWTLLGSSPQDQPYFRNLTEELAEALAWDKALAGKDDPSGRAVSGVHNQAY